MQVLHEANTVSETPYDVAVVGGGAAGLVAALTAATAGLHVILLEKNQQVGGATARSEGMIWAPLSRQAREAGIDDSKAAALQYLLGVSPRTHAPKARAFVENAADMLAFVEAHAPVSYELVAGSYDYYDSAPGALKGGRALRPLPVRARSLGVRLNQVRPPLASTMIFGGMTVASRDLPDYFNVLRSPKALLKVAARVSVYMFDRATGQPRGARIAGGNALVAGLLKGAQDAGVKLVTGAHVSELIERCGRVTGLVYEASGQQRRIEARLGVLLAGGGASWDAAARAAWYAHGGMDGRHASLTPSDGATGDSLKMASQIGAAVDTSADEPAAWSPVSMVPMPNAPPCPFPHYIDRAKPGIIAVDDTGQRFTNEADPYQDFTAAMIKRLVKRPGARFFLVCDHAAIRRYGLGAAPPSPASRSKFIKSGYLKRAASLADLAEILMADAESLNQSAAHMTRAAADGFDMQFNKGASAYNLSNGDPGWSGKNACLGPIKTAPFYAVEIMPGDIATFHGLKTDTHGRIVAHNDAPIPGLYAAGSDAATLAGGTYPAAGMTIGPAMTYGWLAARHMIQLKSDMAYEDAGFASAREVDDRVIAS